MSWRSRAIGLGGAGLGGQLVGLDEDDAVAEVLLELGGQGGEALAEHAHEGRAEEVAPEEARRAPRCSRAR